MLVYNSRMRPFSRKQTTRWMGPFFVYKSLWNGTYELLQVNVSTSVVNGQRLKHFIRHPKDDIVKEITLLSDL